MGATADHIRSKEHRRLTRMQPANGTASVFGIGLERSLRLYIETTAFNVIRCGPLFERRLREERRGNPLFAFLTGGEGSEYYQSLLQISEPFEPGTLFVRE